MPRPARPLAMLVLALATPLCAAMPSRHLEQVAETWLRAQLDQPGTRVEVHAEPLDSRLSLAPCPRKLQASMPPHMRITSRVGVELRCPVPGGWRIRIPVRVQAYRTVLVTTRPLQRGDGLRPGDLQGAERDVTRLGYGYVERFDQVSGRTLARPLNAGSVLTPGDLAKRNAVHAGDHVQLVADLGNVSVRAGGTALGNGDVGARLRVRNDSSGRTVTAVVQSPGVLEALP